MPHVTPSDDAQADPPAVGLDVEWKPAVSAHRKTKASIFQLATRENVYVLDMLTLGADGAPTDNASDATNADATATLAHATTHPDVAFAKETPTGLTATGGAPDGATTSTCAVLNATIAALFTAKHIVKLGVGFSQDLKLLASSYPHLTGFASLTALLDAADLMRVCRVFRTPKLCVPDTRDERYSHDTQVFSTLLISIFISWF